MVKSSIQKHVTLYPSHVDVLDTIIENNSEINNYSEAIRHLCMNYDPDSNQTTDDTKRKLNAMGKEISILTEMVSEFADLHLKDAGILIGTKSKVYQEAKEKVEEKIKSNQTKKYSARSVYNPMHRKTNSFDPTSILKR